MLLFVVAFNSYLAEFKFCAVYLCSCFHTHNGSGDFKFTIINSLLTSADLHVIIFEILQDGNPLLSSSDFHFQGHRAIKSWRCCGTSHVTAAPLRWIFKNVL